jgi:hypothetical protein
MFAAKTCSLFLRANPAEGGDEVVVGITSIAASILLLANDKLSVLKLIISRFSPNSWSGSLSGIMRQRVEYLPQLNKSGNAELQSFIDAETTRLLDVIERENQCEQELERSGTASFE